MLTGDHDALKKVCTWRLSGWRGGLSTPSYSMAVGVKATICDLDLACDVEVGKPNSKANF